MRVSLELYFWAHNTNVSPTQITGAIVLKQSYLFVEVQMWFLSFTSVVPKYSLIFTASALWGLIVATFLYLLTLFLLIYNPQPYYYAIVCPACLTMLFFFHMSVERCAFLLPDSVSTAHTLHSDDQTWDRPEHKHTVQRGLGFESHTIRECVMLRPIKLRLD